jgi:hypothetical protein
MLPAIREITPPKKNVKKHTIFGIKSGKCK